MFYLFPFDKVEKGSKIVLYPAGGVAQSYIQQVRTLNYCNVLFAVDKKYKEIDSIDGISVFSPEAISTEKYDYVVIAISDYNHQSVMQDVNKLKIPKDKIVYSETSFYPKGTISYSQHGEDMVVVNLFKALGIEKPSYIDVGANHPYLCSNTALLHKYGSRGINVEAHPEFLKEFERERPEDININVGVGKESGVLPLYVISKEINTFSFDLAQWWIKQYQERNLKIDEVKEIQVTTLADIIEKYSDNEYPDFIDIDIEGLDYDVLESCDFSKGKPLVICAETGVTAKAITMMQKQGYIPYCVMECNVIYIRESLREKILGVK